MFNHSHVPSLCLTNARSVNNKFDEFSFITTKFHPDFLCVTETWLSDMIPDDTLCIPGYNLFRSDRQTGRKGGGLCVWVNSIFTVDDVIVDSLSVDIELLLIKSHLKSVSIILTVLYFPHGANLSKSTSANLCYDVLSLVDRALGLSLIHI